jgi:hypothetical protein
MAQTPKLKEEEVAAPPTCGVIMPISATVSRSEAQWTDVQKLLHRAIRAAGFDPQNVWEGSATDRISERIISSIFRHPIVVADITDLNPNVMLELGLRLASKKPTIVVVSKGATIPFDIRDFHAVDYPADMSMLGMEDFFARLSIQLKEKHEAAQRDDYNSFLSNVVVDVLAPQERQGTLNEVVLKRLDDLAYLFQRSEINSAPLRKLRERRPPGTTIRYNSASETGVYLTSKDKPTVSRLNAAMSAIGARKTTVLGSSGPLTYMVATFDPQPDEQSAALLQERVGEVASKYNAGMGVDSDLLDHLESALQLQS